MIAVTLTNSDVIAITSVVIALLAFWATFWQAHMTRIHNMLSVAPMLEHRIESYTEDHLSLAIVNVGFGPGILEKVEFRDMSQGNQVLDADRLVDKLILAMQSSKAMWEQTNYIGETAFEPGKSSEIFRLKLSNQFPADKETLEKILKKIQMVIEYRCIYGKKRRYVAGLHFS